MKPKVFVVLGLVAAVSLAAAGAVSRITPGWSSDAGVREAVFPGLGEEIDTASRLVVRNAATELAIVREGDSWVLPGKDGFPADEEKVGGNLFGLAELRRVEPKTQKPELFPRLEVEDVAAENAKSRHFAAFDADGTTLASLVIGKRRPNAEGQGKPGFYVRVDGEDRAWLAGGEISISTELADWLDARLTRLELADVEQVTVEREGLDPLHIARETDGDRKFLLEDVPEGWESKPAFELRLLVKRLIEVEFDDVRRAGDDEPVVTTTIEAADGLRLSMRLYPEGEKRWVRLEASGDGEAAEQAEAINARARGWEFGFSGDSVEDLVISIAEVLKTAEDTSG